MNLEQLRALLAEYDVKMRALLNENPNGLSDAQNIEYEDLEKQFDDTRTAINVAVEREKKQDERSAFLEQNQRQPLTTPVDEDNNGEKKREGALNVYREAFWKAQSRKALSAAETRALSEGASDKGGYLVPETFSKTIVTTLTEKSYMRPLATVSLSTSTENLPIEGVDGANGWIDEGGAYPESDPTVGQVIMKAYKTGRILKVTEELLQDKFSSIEAYISMKFTKSTIKAEELAFVSGDGIGKPTGFLVDATIGKTSASNAAITADELIDLWGSLDEDYAANAVWKMNRNTLVTIMKLKDSSGDYLVNKGLNGAPSTLLGRPIVMNKHMPDVGSATTPISFGDMSYYFIKDRTMMNMKRMDELYATTGHIGFRIDKRVDGKLVLPEAVKLLKMAD